LSLDESVISETEGNNASINQPN